MMMGYGQLDKCGNFLKFSLLIINGIILLGAIILIGIGIWSVAEKYFIVQIMGTNLYAGSIGVILATGIIVLVAAILGCYGAIKEIRCLLITYFVIVFVIFITMLIGGILAYVSRGIVETTIENAMYSSLKSYGNYRPVTDAWDSTHLKLQCCGVRSYNDWHPTLPDSCCRESAPGVRQACQHVSQFNPSVVYSRGCMEAGKHLVKEHALVIGTAAVTVAFLTLLGMLFSCGLYKKIEE